MKAAVFYGKHDLRMEEQPVAVPGDNEVLIKVHACGICGTDVHIFNGDEGAAKSPSGTILGHEFAGEVVQVGAKVKKLKVGDRVCVDPNYLCAECYYCQSGLGHFCENMVGIGTTVNGGFAEYCVVPECQAYVFSKDTSYEKAAMCEPVACCLHGIDMCDIACGDTVAVIGGGMIGLIMLQLARLRGAAKLILIEPVKEKRDMAVSLGADITIDPISTDVVAELAKYGVDRIIFTFLAQNAKARIRFGESVSECCADIGEKNATNDHSPRDFETILPAYSDLTLGETGFRFVRIDILEGWAKLKNVYAASEILVKKQIYDYSGEDKEVEKIFKVAKHTVDLCAYGNKVWDGIKRDRLIWIGDMHPESMALAALYGRIKCVENSLDIVKEEYPLPLWMKTTRCIIWHILRTGPRIRRMRLTVASVP